MSRKSKKRQSRRRRTTGKTQESGVQVGPKPKKFESRFNPDYTETVKDLKRIGILAGTFFVILIGISIYFNYIGP